MDTATDSSLIGQATELLERHEWRAAFDLLSAQDAERALSPAALELLAQAAWWTGQLPVAIDARERAYATATRAGDVTAATIAAISLGRDNLMRMSTSVANGWLNRAERLIADLPEGLPHGWLATARAFYAALTGDAQRSLAEAERAQRIGAQFGDRELEIFGLSERAASLMALGRVEEGLAAADEATVAAISGEVPPMTAGGVCCATIEACTAMGDLRRAAEWTDAQDRWCRREGINGYPGMCRLFRSEIKRMRGAWAEAEAEARVASTELRGFIPAASAVALQQIGEIRLRRGDLPAAEEALLAAHAAGQDPEPALSLLRLAQGNVPAAADGIRRALDEPGQVPSWKAPPASDVYRLNLLPAQVEIALAARDAATAHAATDELQQLAERFGTLTARASALTARGSVELADGELAPSVQHLRDAVRLWAELDAPYELARARLVLADAYIAQEARPAAVVELRAARATFERLGALPDQRRAEAMLDELRDVAGEAPVGMETTRAVRAFMFTEIVDSTLLAERLGDAAWDRLLREHDRLLRTAAAEQGGEEVKATGDGFFFAFAEPRAAIEAAVAMQRRLATWREADSGAPQVRIGIHRAEANRVGLDYIGSGVNLAARIADAAEAGEILVSAATVAAKRGSHEEGARRTVELKGVSAPIEVVALARR